MRDARKWASLLYVICVNVVVSYFYGNAGAQCDPYNRREYHFGESLPKTAVHPAVQKSSAGHNGRGASSSLLDDNQR